MVYKDELERIRRELIERKDDLMQELNNLPIGELVCTDQEGYRRYLQRIPAKGNRKKEHRYGVKKQPKVLNGLVRKAYVTDALKIIDQDIRVVELACKKYKPIDEEVIMRQFLAKYPELKEGIYYGPIDTEEWVNRFPRMNNYHPENLIHTTYNGIRSRSKNELYIASRLDHYGIIYRWDCPTGIPGLYRNPDYTILRRRDWKIIYWEHFGMMDIPSYKAEYRVKMKEYEAAGIVPWENLIMTFDTEKGGMRADIIEAMIKCWLL